MKDVTCKIIVFPSNYLLTKASNIVCYFQVVSVLKPKNCNNLDNYYEQNLQANGGMLSIFLECTLTELPLKIILLKNLK